MNWKIVVTLITVFSVLGIAIYFYLINTLVPTATEAYSMCKQLEESQKCYEIMGFLYTKLNDNYIPNNMSIGDWSCNFDWSRILNLNYTDVEFCNGISTDTLVLTAYFRNNKLIHITVGKIIPNVTCEDIDCRNLQEEILKTTPFSLDRHKLTCDYIKREFLLFVGEKEKEFVWIDSLWMAPLSSLENRSSKITVFSYGFYLDRDFEDGTYAYLRNFTLNGFEPLPYQNCTIEN